MTVNVYFPAQEVRDAAEDIVDETWGGEPAALLGIPGRAVASVIALIGPSVAHAAEPDIEVSTAAIRALKAAMSERAASLKPHLTSGAVGLGADGMLALRSLDELDLKAKAEVRRAVEAENRDRAQLYREIAAANDYGAERVADIQRIFAEVWISRAQKGWWIESPPGTWKRR